jgi:hypothetical protein
MSYFPPYLWVATISLLNLSALLFRWTRGVESRFLVWSWRGLLGRPLHRSTPVKAYAMHNFLSQWCIFFRPTGHYVRDNYSVLSNMVPVYHIVTVRVIWTSLAHVWRLRFRFLRTGYDTFCSASLSLNSEIFSMDSSCILAAYTCDANVAFFHYSFVASLPMGRFLVELPGEDTSGSRGVILEFDSWVAASPAELVWCWSSILFLGSIYLGSSFNMF